MAYDLNADQRAALQPYVEAGQLIHGVVHSFADGTGRPAENHAYALPGQGWRIDDLHRA